MDVSCSRLPDSNNHEFTATGRLRALCYNQEDKETRQHHAFHFCLALRRNILEAVAWHHDLLVLIFFALAFELSFLRYFHSAYSRHE